MQNIKTTEDLKIAIQMLELEQSLNVQLMKNQLHITYESLKPANLLKNTLNEITSSPLLIDNILGASLGLASGYFTKKIVVNGSHNIFRNLLGTVLQFGVTNLIARNPNTIKTFGQTIFEKIFHKK